MAMMGQAAKAGLGSTPYPGSSSPPLSCSPEAGGVQGAGVLGSLADELGALEKEYAVAMAAWEAKLARMGQLRDALRAACPAQAAEEWHVEGQRFGCTLSARAMVRTVHVAKLVRKIGARAFASIAGVTLGALQAKVDPETVAEVVTAERTGPRRIVTFEKGFIPLHPERAFPAESGAESSAPAVSKSGVERP